MWFGPGAATLVFVIGISLAVAPALSHDRTWARRLMALCGAALLLRYVARRLTATLDAEASLGSHRRLEFQAICTIDALVVHRSAAGTAVRFAGMEERPGSN